MRVASRHVSARIASIAILSAFCATGAFAGPPDFVEDFSSFTGIRPGTASSPNDTGSQWVILGGGVPSTQLGFQVDDQGFHGKGLTWSGAETSCMIENQNFQGSALAPKAHQLAFTLRFTRAQGAPGTADFMQVVGSVPLDFNAAAPNPANYVIAVGHSASSAEGMLVFLPSPSGQGFQSAFLPATPDVWNKVVVQYTPSTVVNGFDAKIRVWVNPVAGTEGPHLEVTGGNLRSPAGVGPLARFALGNSTDLAFGRDVRVGTSTAKVDTMAGWYGTNETRAGSLADAIAYFDSLGGASATNWASYGEDSSGD